VAGADLDVSLAGWTSPRARPRPEIASRACERGAIGAQTGHNRCSHRR
jgi:hypothetical protein